MRHRRMAALVLLSAASALAGCGTGAAGPTAPPTTVASRGPVTSGAASSGAATSGSATSAPMTSGTVRPTPPPGAVPSTLAFTSGTVDGRPFDAASLAGRPAVLWFWAAWCARCRAAADDVAGVQREFAGSVNVVGVAGLRSGTPAMERFVRETGLGGFPHLADDDGAVWRRFGVTTQEYYVILDAAGAVVHKGQLTSGQLRERVSALAR